MGNYWKRRFYKNKKKLEHQKKQLKVLLFSMIGISIIFGSLFFIGFTTEQVSKEIKTNSDQVWTILGVVISAISGYLVLTVLFGIIAFVIWSWYKALNPEPPSYSGGY